MIPAFTKINNKASYLKVRIRILAQLYIVLSDINYDLLQAIAIYKKLEYEQNHRP